MNGAVGCCAVVVDDPASVVEVSSGFVVDDEGTLVELDPPPPAVVGTDAMVVETALRSSLVGEVVEVADELVAAAPPFPAAATPVDDGPTDATLVVLAPVDRSVVELGETSAAPADDEGGDEDVSVDTGGISSSTIDGVGAVVDDAEIVDIDAPASAGTDADSSGRPGFCQIDCVVESPTSGNRTSWNASADPAETVSTTSRVVVPTARRAVRDITRRPGRRVAGASGRTVITGSSRLDA